MEKRPAWLTCVAVTFLLALGGTTALAQGSFGLLHSFTGATNDGAIPEGTPLLIGENLYGVTFFGGTASDGGIYVVSTNSTGFNLVYSFTGGTNGANPYGSLVSDGSTLYGMTFNGGVDDGGIIFGVGTNGTGFTVLHTFLGGDNDGLFPFGSLIINGSILYGMTALGGTNDAGVIFKMNTDGTAFSVVHSFDGAPNDGQFPSEGVILSGSTLYGTTFFGGSNDLGIVFAMDTAASSNAFKILHQFGGTNANDGASPSGPLTLDGSTLYGITTAGGSTNSGVVFRLNTSGTGFALLHQFQGGANDGASPQFGPLVVTNSTIYGAAELGGTANAGVLFQMATDGTGFAISHSFSTNATDGAFPFWGPIFIDGTLFGATVNGGSNNLGVVYGDPATNVQQTCTNTLTQVSAIQIVSNTLVITVPSVICMTYQLQYSDEMVPTNWINIVGASQAGTGGPIQFVQPIAACVLDGVCAPAPSGLVSWWPGDGNALDIAGGGNNGILSNSATFAAGEVCEAFSFTTNHAGVVVGSPANLQLTTFTIECWFRRHSSTQLSNDPSCDNGWLFGYGHNGYGFLIEKNSAGGNVLSLTQTDFNHEDGGPSITDTSWHHGAVSWSGTTAVFYFDGVSYPGSACLPVGICFNFSFTTPAGIGARADNLNGINECAFNGDVDEVSVYNRVLTSGEIQSIFQAGPAGKCKSTPLHRFYRVDEFP